MRCGAEVVTLALAVLCQTVGTTFLGVTVTLVLSCSDTNLLPDDDLNGELGLGDVCQRFCEDGSRPTVNRRDGCSNGLECLSTQPSGMISFDNCYGPDTCQKAPSPCGCYSIGQPCVTGANLRHCQALVAGGCATDQLLAMESCPLQFSCSSGGPGRVQAQQPSAPPVAAGAAVSISVPVVTTSGDGEDLCDNREKWIAMTKVFGLLGALMLTVAMPLLSCHANGCVGPGKSRRSRLAWGLYGLCALMFCICGVLGLGYSVEIPMVVPVVGTLAFGAAFMLMLHNRFCGAGPLPAPLSRNLGGGVSNGSDKDSNPLVAPALLVPASVAPIHAVACEVEVAVAVRPPVPKQLAA
jgi:hypothetical protein